MAIEIVRADGTVPYINPSAQRLFGRSRGEYETYNAPIPMSTRQIASGCSRRYGPRDVYRTWKSNFVVATVSGSG